MNIWVILIGVLAVLGLALWLTNSPPAGPQPGSQPSAPSSNEQQGKPETPPSEPTEQPQPPQPSAPADLAQLLCPGTSDAPKPEPRRPTLTVMTACVAAQGRVMFVTRLPDTEDYLLKIWLSPRYTALRQACGTVTAKELQDLDPYPSLNITITKDDWSKFSKILQPGGPGSSYQLAIQVTAQGVYVFSTETNRNIYGPHCEIHPLQKLELLEEKKEESK